MKRNTIKKIASMLGKMFLFSNPVLSAAKSYNDDLYYDAYSGYYFDDEDEENENPETNNDNLGLFSCLVNKGLKIGGVKENKLNFSYRQEILTGLLFELLYNNIESRVRYRDYENNPFSSEMLDATAKKEKGEGKLEKLRWIISYLHEKNSIKFGSVDAYAYAKYPFYLLRKSKLMNLFVPQNRKNLLENMQLASSLYQTQGSAICADNAKILYLWAKLNRLKRIMVIEGYHCYTMIKIDRIWYRPEPLDPGKEGEKWPRLQKFNSGIKPTEGRDRKILLINPDKKLEDQKWEDIKVWDLDINNIPPTWDYIYEKTKKLQTDPERKISGNEKILTTKDLQWKIQWWY